MQNFQRDIDAALPQFGLNSFRPGQREVIANVVAGHDCLCVMPTGGGKSLCYQLPAVVRDGLTIVVSPLIALMKDQVDTLRQRGIPATLINSSLTTAEQSDRLSRIMRGDYRLVYIAPERLRNNRFLEAIRATPISLLAIDEAHCISEWGHDFRPDYARLGRFREALGMVQTIALTATATERVRRDISDILRLKNAKEFITGFARKNLHFGATICNGERDKNQQLIEYLQAQSGSGIIYAATRKRCESVLELIRAEVPQLAIDVYHAGLSNDQRKAIQEQFMTGKLRVIVATNAFGMGIDKSDLRFVVHYNLPGSIEAYYQEAGRAGRDGKSSACVLQYSSQDRYVQEFFIENANPPPELVKKVYEFLCDQTADPIELTAEEIRDRIGSQMSGEAINTAVQILAKTGVIDRLEVGGGLAMVRIDSTLPTLVDLLPKEAKIRRKVLRAVEKAIGDQREEPVYVHPRYLMQLSGVDKDALTRALGELRKLEAFDYVPPFRGRAVHFRQRGVAFDQLGIDFKALEERKKADYDKLDRVIAYARSPQCRQLNILEYFGDMTGEPCGGCDRCQGIAGWPKVQSETVETATEQASTPEPSSLTPEQREVVRKTLSAIQRLHGRLGKMLIADYLGGSDTVKVQRLKLQKLSDFGLLKDYRKKDITKILDTLIATAVLEQREMNANRPTVFLTSRGEQLMADAKTIPHDIAVAFGFSKSSPTKKPATRKGAEASPAPISTASSVTMQSDSGSLEPSISDFRREPLTGEIAHREAANFTLPAHELQLSPDEPDIQIVTTTRHRVDSLDWTWTAKLADHGFKITEIMAIRRMGINEVIDDLVVASDAGKAIACEELLDRRTQLAVKNYLTQSASGNLRLDQDNDAVTDSTVERLAALVAAQNRVIR